MISGWRVLTMAEMHGRDQVRRRLAIGLLVALPLSFYASAAGGDGARPFVAGGVGLAFSVSGVTLFSVLSSNEVDQRLVLCGYRPVELLLGRVLFLGPFGIALAVAFALLMTAVSHPERPWLLGLGAVAAALQSVPFGLAVGSAFSKDLEGTLVIIGVVGMQLALDADAFVAGLLPFHGAQRVITAGAVGHGAVLAPLLVTAAYGLGLFVVARIVVARRVRITRHPQPER
jgi:hypothetical protein